MFVYTLPSSSHISRKIHSNHLAILHLGNQLVQDRKGAMGKTPSTPADKLTVGQAAPYHEIAADSSDSERTISEGYVGIMYGDSQTHDGNLEGESAMVLLATDSSDSERTISEGYVGILYGGSQTQDGDLEGESAMVLPAVGENTTARSNIHGYTRSLEIDSASRTERHAARSDSFLVAQRRHYIQIYPEWLEKIDSGKKMWTALKQFQANGKHEERSSDTSTNNLQDYRWPTKRQRTKAQTSTSLSTGAQTTTTSTKLPHGFI
ncbi:hypothetical protein ACQJBY_071779 [Aegilops geniculata]